VALRGEGAVALVTGEERVMPPSPSYFVCTVEAMPLDRRVDFLAVDEIQLAADRERGHVFTDRMLRPELQDTAIFAMSRNGFFNAGSARRRCRRPRWASPPARRGSARHRRS